MKAHIRFGLAGDGPAAPVERLGHLPVIEIVGISGREIERELSSLGTEPEAIFAAEHVHVRLSLTRADRGSAEPSEARRIRTSRGAGEDASLVVRGNDDPRPIGRSSQDDDRRVLSQELEIRRKAW